MICETCGKEFECNKCTILVRACLCLDCMKTYKENNPHITQYIFDKAFKNCFGEISIDSDKLRRDE